MAKASKLLHREPNGRHSRAEQGNPSPATVRRLRDAAARGMAAPEWGSEIGRLWLEGKITGRQYQAGKTFTELRAAYISAIAAPPEAPSVSIGEKASRGHTDGLREVRRHRRDIMRYDAAVASVGPQAADVLVLLCERDTVMVGASLTGLNVWLSALADHFGLPY